MIIAILTLLAASSAVAQQAAVQNGGILPADQRGLEVGADRNDYTLTFAIDSIPPDPKLQLDFKVVRKGRCPITYRATSIYLNKRLLTQIDFRRFAKNDDKSITIDVPQKVLKPGENQLLIRTGWCQYDIDVLRLNNLTLVRQ